MADYSANATQLSGPQGAGAQVVAPVQEQVVPNNIVSSIANLGEAFANSFANSKKEEQEKRKNDIIGQYVKNETVINDAVSQGLDAGQAAARSRANANKFLASYPEYYKEFKDAGSALKGLTEAGEVEDELKMQRELYKGQVSRAQSAGYTIDASMPKTLIDSQLRSHETEIRAQKQMDEMYKRNGERRSQNAEERQVFDRELKTTSIRLLNEIAGDRLDSASQYVANLAGNVKSGKVTHEVAQQQLAREFSTINASLQSAASVNPELAGPYRSLFGDMQKLGQELLDPKNQVKDAENQLKELILRQKLILASDPKNASIFAASELLGPNASVALSAGNQITNHLAKMLTTDQYQEPLCVDRCKTCGELGFGEYRFRQTSRPSAD